MKIAVLRCNGLGDLVFSLPALESLRAAYPDAEIVLLGSPWAAELLGSRPSPVDRIVPVPVVDGVRGERGQRQDPVEVEAFVRRMRAERFDLALQMHGGGRASNPFVRRLGARVTVGFRSPDAAPLDRCIPYVFLQPEVLRYLELVRLAGAGPATLTPHLAVTDDDRAAAAGLLAGDGPFALLHAGATDPRRRWAPESFAQVGDGLAAAGVSVLLTEGPADRDPADAVEAAMRRPVTRVALSLSGLVGVAAGSSVVVGNDSGPLHLAAAVGTATVGLYWGPNAVNSPPPWRTRHRPIAAFDVACPICGTDTLRHSCEHDASSIDSIRPDEVVAAAVELLGGTPPDAGALERALDPRAAQVRAPVA